MREYSNVTYSMRYPDRVFYTDNKFTLLVTPTIPANIRYLRVNIQGNIIDFNIYGTNEQCIDLSDIARSYSPGSASLIVQSLNENKNVTSTMSFSSTLLDGFYTNREVLPLKKYTLCSLSESQPVHIRMSVTFIVQQNISGQWMNLETLYWPDWFDRELGIGTYRIITPDRLTDPYEFIIEKVADCSLADSITLEWTGENGRKKKYTYPIVNEIRTTKESTELSRCNDGYTVEKGKSVQLEILLRSVDLQTRLYVADMVYARTISAFYLDDNQQRVDVPITAYNSSVSVDVDERYADISMTLNVSQHDIF